MVFFEEKIMQNCCQTKMKKDVEPVVLFDFDMTTQHHFKQTILKCCVIRDGIFKNTLADEQAAKFASNLDFAIEVLNAALVSGGAARATPEREPEMVGDILVQF